MESKKKTYSIIIAGERLAGMPSLVDSFSAGGANRLRLAQSGEEALALARQDTPHLVVVDNHLGDMDGLELCRRLLIVNALINTVALSPLDEDDFHEASEGLGILAHLPLEPDLNQVEEALDKLNAVAAMLPF